RAAREPEPPSARGAAASQSADSGLSLAMRAGSEFVGAVVVGAAIGWALDRLVGTNPLFLIVFFFIGGAAGGFNVIRLTSAKGAKTEQDSRLSHAEVADKGLRAGPGAASDARRGEAAGRANPVVSDVDDDED